MMRFFLTLFVFISSLSIFAVDTLRIGVISDLHYLSPLLMDANSSALDAYIIEGGKNVRAVPAVLQQVLHQYDSLQIDVLLISGDLTKDGEKQSHQDLIELLKPLQEKGIRVFVVPGNHDINMPNAVAFTQNGTEKVTNVSASQFASLYQNCGYGNALYRDSSSLSYVAQLTDDTWLLTLDVALYDEYTTHSLSAGTLKPQTETWAVNILDEAQRKGITVLGMMHWGLVEHVFLQQDYFAPYLVDDWKRLATLFANKGMKAIFTGHFHATDITAHTTHTTHTTHTHTTPAEATIYDIETATLSSYPFAYRVIDYYKTGMNISTANITSTADYPNLMQDDKVRLHQMAMNVALSKLKSAGIPTDIATKMSQLLAQIFILHVMGDEKIDIGLMDHIAKLATMLDADTDENHLHGISLDYTPADNNVNIKF